MLSQTFFSTPIPLYALFFSSSATNSIISAKDHASVQLAVADVDEEGRMTGGFKTYAFCGTVRGMVSADVSTVACM